MTEIERLLRDRIARYVASIITLDELTRSLPDGWELDQADDPDARRLTLLVTGFVTDYERGNLSASELRERLGGEASWRLERVSATVNPAHPPVPLETSVHAGVGREPLEVLAS